jgi:hypothetical protein
VLLTLPQATACGLLNSLGVERFTARAPYRFTLEAKTGETWRKIWEQDDTTPVGKPLKIKILEKDLRASQFRFRCTSVLGAIIGDMTEIDLNGYFKD